MREAYTPLSCVQTRLFPTQGGRRNVCTHGVVHFSDVPHTPLVRVFEKRTHPLCACEREQRTYPHTHTRTHAHTHTTTGVHCLRQCAPPTRVVRCHMPDGRRHLRKSRVFRPRRQYALGRPAPPPAHSTDTSVTAGTHFALVGQNPRGFCTQEGRKKVHKGVLPLTSHIHPQPPTDPPTHLRRMTKTPVAAFEAPSPASSRQLA